MYKAIVRDMKTNEEYGYTAFKPLYVGDIITDIKDGKVVKLQVVVILF